MPEEWKNERPGWCPHTNCSYRLRAQDAACVGRLPLPIPHGEDSNDYRFCLNGALESGEVFDLLINDSDIYHFKRLFDALQDGESNLVDMIDDQPITKMPTQCYAVKSNGLGRKPYAKCEGKVSARAGFMVCEECGVSYGRAGKGKG